MRKNRALYIALGVSALFHLSMVTLFSIGIWFEVNPVEYYRFDIVAEAPASAPPDAPRQVLRVPSPEFSPAEAEAMPQLTLPAATTALGAPPTVQLPTLQFAELSRLRLRERSLEIRAQRTGQLEEDRGDSWARFGQELEDLRSTIAGLPLFEQGLDAKEPPSSKPQRISIPAEGFEVYIEWMTAPTDRQVLFSPPIEALWKLEPNELGGPISFVFRVGPGGRVREVLPGSIDVDTSLVLSVARALTHYRFEALEEGNNFDQHGTLLILPSGTAVP